MNVVNLLNKLINLGLNICQNSNLSKGHEAIFQNFCFQYPYMHFSI
jgi:hypothetical protein